MTLLAHEEAGSRSWARSSDRAWVKVVASPIDIVSCPQLEAQEGIEITYPGPPTKAREWVEALAGPNTRT